MSFETWVFIGILVVFVGVCLWRWNVVNRPALTDEQCERFSEMVIEDLFNWASDAGVFVRIRKDYWQRNDLTDSQWIYLCRWMAGRGIVYTPDGWGLYAIICNDPPSGLALTPKTMGLAMNGRRQSDIFIGDGNGPINIGGQQIVISGQSLGNDDLLALIEALQDDANNLPEPDASSVIAAANSLQGAVDGRLSETSPEVIGALEWVRKRASEAVGSAGGAALFASTVEVLKALGWVS